MVANNFVEIQPVYVICDKALASIAGLIQQGVVSPADGRVVKVVVEDESAHDTDPLGESDAIPGTLEQIFARAMSLLK